MGARYCWAVQEKTLRIDISTAIAPAITQDFVATLSIRASIFAIDILMAVTSSSSIRSTVIICTGVAVRQTGAPSQD